MRAAVPQSPKVSQAQSPEAASRPPAPERLFGDWAGAQPALRDRGATVRFNYITESAGNVTGGLDQGATYAHQLALQTDLLWERLVGARGFATNVLFVQRAGRSTSAEYLGDNLLQVQEIFGGGGGVPVHLVYASVEESLFEDRLNVAVGRMPVLLDFASSPLYCSYMSVAICGNPHGVAVETGLSAFPNSTWGGRVRVRPTSETYVQAGLYEVNPVAGGRWGFKWSTARATGVSIPVELGYQPLFGPDYLIGHLKIGLAYDTSTYAEWSAEPRGPAVPGPSKTGRATYWILVDQMFVRTGPGPAQGLIGLLGYTRADPRTSVLVHYAIAGLLGRGLLSSRPKDAVGLIFAYAQVSDTLRAAQVLDEAAGRPLSGGAQIGPQTRELVFEANYNVHAYRGVQLMADVQHIVRPGASDRVGNAWVLGIKSNVEF